MRMCNFESQGKEINGVVQNQIFFSISVPVSDEGDGGFY